MTKRKVFLVTGFNNWGKTTLLSSLFGVGAFHHDQLHRLPNTAHDFLVLPKSNDDIRLRGYCEEYYDRMDKIAHLERKPTYIASAFCPTRELEARVQGGPKRMTSIDIIQELYGADEVHMILIKYKWCGHAELRPEEIGPYYAGLPNVHVKTIASSSPDKKLADLRATISSQLP